MKTKKPNAELVWKQIEDQLVPRLPMSTTDRAVYAHLVRHSRLEGKRQLRFSIKWLARGTRLTLDPVRQAVRRLVGHGALGLLERSKAGHIVEVRLPEEIPATRVGEVDVQRPASLARPGNLERTDFLQTRALRAAIHAREGGVCFYCLRRVPYRVRCLDHVVPRAQNGRNSYRNLVSCCHQCNCQKGEMSAEDFLRGLYRTRKLTEGELAARLRAFDVLAAGKLPPPVASTANPLPRKGRTPLHPASS